MTTPQPPRWYSVNNMSMATLCADQADAEMTAKDCNIQWPRQAPHRAVQLVEVSGCGLGRDEILSMALEAKAGVYLPAEAGLPATWVGQDFAMLERFAALVAAKVIARTPPPPMVVSMSDVDQAQLAAMLAKAPAMPLVAAPDDSGVMRLGKLWSQARAVHPDDPAWQNASFLAALGVFEELVTADERTARIAAQVENGALKAERARSGLAHRKAVQEAVREAKDAANLATATACADVCAEMAQQLRGHGDVAGAEIAEALRDAIRARGAT